uniref:EpsG family protein n=1 Tax=Lactococcus sp. TaxID=44273 RepID=UPI00324205F1
MSFSFSLLLLCLAEKMTRRSRYVTGFIALMIPCFLAAFRAETIGTDVRAYLIPMFENAKNARGIVDFFGRSWMQLYTQRSVASIEIGFSLLVYIATKIFSSLYALQFFIQLLTIIPVWCALEKLSDYLDKRIVVVGMMVYYAMCYNYSLNLMRQYIAIGFLVLSFSYLITGNKKNYAIFQAIAFNFHYSAISGLVIYVIYEYIAGKFIPFKTDGDDYKCSKNRSILVMSVSTLAIIALPSLLNVIVNRFGEIKYIGYINGAFGLSINQIVLRLPLLVILMLSYKKLRYTYGNKWLLMPTVVVLNIIVSQLVNADGSASSSGAYRIVLYFSALLIIIIPIMYATYNTKRDLLYRVLLVGYLLVWWLYYFGFAEGSTVPYLSIWS